MTDYMIERPTETDYDALTALWEQSVRATHGFLEESDLLLYRELLRNQYLAMVGLHCIRIEGKIAGFVGVAGNTIEMLFVEPACFFKGIGKALAVYAIDQLGCRLVDVNEQNSQALAFYQRLGFHITGRSATDGLGKAYPLLHMRMK